jgi:choline dehydrogenase-like flavoprotein
MNFRKSGFKLENVFAPPVGLAMLLPQMGKNLQKIMRSQNHFACIEVAVRDTNPGRIFLNNRGNIQIEKTLNEEDRKRKNLGLRAMNNVFKSTGAKNIFSGSLAIGLHLMGGCKIGKSSDSSLVNPDFELHGSKNIFIADSSIFPNAPGINPSLTIMALSLMASERIKERLRGN